MAKANRRQRAVRMLDHAVRLMPTGESSLSGMAAGRLASDLRKYVRLLRNLARDDPDNRFWEVLQRAILKLGKYLRRARG